MFTGFTAGLAKTSRRIGEGLSLALAGRTLDAEGLETLEEALIGADLGVAVSARLCAALARRKFPPGSGEEAARAALAEEIAAMLAAVESDWAADAGTVRIFVGVNGCGKTSCVGKLAHRIAAGGAGVTIGACDTFRAAATEQLRVWAARAGARLVAGAPGADAAGLAFDATRAGLERGDGVLIDTAGRLQNKSALMDELSRLVRAVRKASAGVEPEIVLVVDAGAGGNALQQADGFGHAVGVTGMIVTKLDGTARGGCVVAIADRVRLPVHFVGTGEGFGDLHRFRARAFAHALLDLGAGTEI